VQIVGSRDHGKQQNQGAGKRTKEDDWTQRQTLQGTIRTGSLPPQKKGGQQQG
jgi:hypothetical protein